MTDHVDITKRRPAKLRKLHITRVDRVTAGAAPDAHITLYKSQSTPQEEPAMPDPTTDPTPEEVAAKAAADLAAATLAQEHAQMRAELDALKAMDPTDVAALLGLELVAKTEEPPAVELPESIKKQLADGEALRVRVEKMEADAERATYIAKAADFANIGGAAELGPVLYSLAKADAEAYKQLETYLTAANAAVDESRKILTKERGTGLTGSPTLEGELEALVKAEQLATPTLTEVQARANVLSAHPDLYSRYLETKA